MPKATVPPKDPGYKIVGVELGVINYKSKDIDLRTITKKEALILAKDPNFPYLVESGA